MTVAQWSLHNPYIVSNVHRVYGPTTQNPSQTFQNLSIGIYSGSHIVRIQFQERSSIKSFTTAIYMLPYTKYHVLYICIHTVSYVLYTISTYYILHIYIYIYIYYIYYSMEDGREAGSLRYASTGCAVKARAARRIPLGKLLDVQDACHTGTCNRNPQEYVAVGLKYCPKI